MTAEGEPNAGIRIEDRDGEKIAWLTVDHPGKINILNSFLIDRLREALAEAIAVDGLRAIVLSGAGDKAFIGGADIREMVDLTPDTARRFITNLHGLCDGLRRAPVPVIARIDGFCLGGGLEVAAACDLRVASGKSVFGMPEVRVGIPSVIEAALLPRLIGSGKTRDLVLTGRSMEADEAAACGLVDRVVPPDELDAAVEGWLGDILACGANALRLQKQLINAWEEKPLDASIAESIDLFAGAFTEDEPARMMKAFMNRAR